MARVGNSVEAERIKEGNEQTDRNYSYELTQKLTFFIISIELVFCGYILLNADRLGVIEHSSLLFLCAGVAVFFGLFWRYLYNSRHYDITHKKECKHAACKLFFCNLFYFSYIGLTVLFFAGIIAVGFMYLRAIESSIS